MAKVSSTITLRGTYGGITFVKSHAYGDHVRAARGTHKKAKLNASFKKQNKKLVKSNLPAQILRNAINPYRQDFHYGRLWQNLVSMTNDALEEGAPFDFSKLQPFDIHPEYPLARLLSLSADTTVDRDLSKLQVTVDCNMPPTFDPSLLLDGYRLQVVILFPDLKTQTAKTEAVHSEIMGLTEKIGIIRLHFSIPRGAKTFLVCVRIDGCDKGAPHDTLTSKGMRMVEAGRV